MVKKFLCTFLCACIFLTASFADIIHIIKKGETIYGLSKQYGVAQSVILQYNGLTENSKILVGQKIKIPENIMPAQKAAQTYIVKKGDTIYGIAKHFGISAKEIFALNNLNANSVIKVGQKIKIPLAATPSPAAPAAPKKQTQNNATDSLRTYTEKKANTKILWPITPTKISYLDDKTSGVAIEGSGADIVKSIASGKVVSTGSYRGYSNVVFVKSNNDYIYVYAGLKDISAKVGQNVAVSTPIGTLPEKALLTPSRLYFMVYKKNASIDPALAPRGL